MARLGQTRLGTGTIAGDFSRTPPTVTITAPTGSVTSTTFTVTWTYSSLVGRTQDTYRVRLLSKDGTTVLYDSGAIDGTSTSASVTYDMSPGSIYMIEVQCSDGIDIGIGTMLILYDVVGFPVYPIQKDVGSLYEVGINGVGYMLADHPERERRYRRQVVPLDSPRLSTSETPFSQAIDRYTLASSIDWSDGAGQRIHDRERSSEKAYRRSDLVDPFTPGELKLAPASTVKHSDSYANARAVIAGGQLYVLSADGEFSVYSDPADTTPTVFTIAGAAAFRDVCSDGINWYYADGANVYRNSTPASAAAWSASNAEKIAWCSDRIVIARSDGTSATPNVVAVLAENGTEVGGSQIWTFQAGSTVRSITSGDGYVWWAITRGDVSSIYAWKLGSTESYFTAFDMPTGQEARTIGYYQGNVFIRAADGTGRATIYRAITQDGVLSPTKVLDIAEDVDNSDGEFAGDDRRVYFSWRGMGLPLATPANVSSGVGAIDLVTGGWTRWCVHPGVTVGLDGPVRSVIVWRGRVVFTIDSVGAVMASADDGAGYDGTAPVGVLETSLYDLGTGLRKRFSEVSATFDPIPAGGRLTISWSIDGGNTYTDLTAVTVAGSRSARWTIDVESDTISFRIKIENTDTGLTPVFRTLTVRANPVGLADQILVLPINCADNVAGLNGRPIPNSAAGDGARRARQLEQLAQTRVTVQDIDWAVTKATYDYDVLAVEVESVGVFDPHKNRQSHEQVAVLTLRRTFK